MTDQTATPRPPRAFKQSLPCRLTEAEKARIAGEVAALYEKLSEQETAKKASADRAKAEIELTTSQMRELLSTYRRGTEDRDVECLETFLFDTNTATVTRTDTGETVSTRALSAAERQAMLPFPKEEPQADSSDEPTTDGEASEAKPQKTTTKKPRRR